MPRDKRAKKVAAAPDLEDPLEDRISALPDGILQHVLGFLPADEAVKTCVLARHWRHQWRFVRRLRIIHSEEGPRSSEEFVRFVNRLLLLREPGVPLDEFEVSSDDSDDEAEIKAEIHFWIRHALLCKVRILFMSPYINLHTPLISQHLRRLEVEYVSFDTDYLDFVTCPALEVLDMTNCGLSCSRIDFMTCPALEVLNMTYSTLSCSRILSQSLKHLRIIDSHFNIQACISMPSLISLRLNNFSGEAPLLEFMPSLQTAFVRPENLVDACTNKDDYEDDCCGICAYCCGEDDHRGRSILLGGLSNAVHLELIAYRGTFIYKRDLRWCPTFAKLRTLLLNEWCVAIDFSALVCILEHSPALEKLILQISEDTKCKSESEGRKHHMERVPQVNIIRVTRDSNSFSFEN